MTKRAPSLEEYNHLPEQERMQILHRDGVYVGKRKIGKQTVVLFQLYGFYIEVFYKQYRKQIDHTVASDSTDVLQPYINQIGVKGLDEKPPEE